jgi:hypothetical protein
MSRFAKAGLSFAIRSAAATLHLPGDAFAALNEVHDDLLDHRP